MEFVTNPTEIETKSFEAITEILGAREFEPKNENVIKRVIHTTADFDYAENMVFSQNAVDIAKEALTNGATIVTDTTMVRAGINKRATARLGCEVVCFIDAPEVAQAALEKGSTRARAAVDRAVETIDGPIIFAVGNAPTTLIRIYELIMDGTITPELIIGVPVGFINVVESKELILQLENTPYIVAKGRKGGSNVAAAICNALLYELTERD